MIVVDTSAILELLLHTPVGARHADRIFDQERHAPELIDLEFVNALRRYVRLGVTALAEADEALAKFTNFGIERHAHKTLLPRIWALRDSVSTYDASYVALAEMLDVPLLTCDARLSRTHGHSAKIELLS
jgi:predicted nucleic acid-binding protein